MDEYNRAYFDTDQYSQIWWGASRLALTIIKLIDNAASSGDKAFKNPAFIKSVLEFLLKSKSDMLTFVMNGGELSILCAQMHDKKNGNTVKPYRLVHYDGKSPEVAKTEYISEDEYKWRETARILAEAFDDAVTCVSAINGRTKAEISNRFLSGKKIGDIPDAPSGKKLISESDVGEITLEIKPDSSCGIEDICKKGE